LNILEYIGMLLQTGLGSLAAYLAAHVLLCLLPAFLIAGALAALIPKEAGYPTRLRQWVDSCWPSAHARSCRSLPASIRKGQG